MGKYLGPTACDVIEKRHRYRCFPVSFANFFRTAFFFNTSGQLLLIDVSKYVLSKNIFNPIQSNVASRNPSYERVVVCVKWNTWPKGVNPFHATDLFCWYLENIRKPLVFRYFQGVSKEISGMKWVQSLVWDSPQVPMDIGRNLNLLKTQDVNSIYIRLWRACSVVVGSLGLETKDFQISASSPVTSYVQRWALFREPKRSIRNLRCR